MERLLRRLLVVFGLLAAIPALSLAAALAVLQVPPVQRGLADLLSRSLSAPQSHVSISGLRIGWSLDATIARIAIADAEGPWLSMSQVRFDWSPLRLWRGLLDIRRLSAGGVTVYRRPVDGGEPGGAAPSAGMPSLPVAMRISQLAAQVDLEEAAVGQPVRITIDGAGEWTAGAIRLSLHAEQAGGGASVAADWGYDEAAGRLHVDVGFNEPASQLMASLSGITGLPPMAGRLRGDGLLSDWRGRLAMTSQADTCLTADLHLARGVALEMAAEGALGTRCFDSAALRTLAPDGVSFDVDMAWTGGDRLHIGGGWVSTAAASLSFGGAIVGGAAEDLRFEIDVAELSRIGILAGLEMTGRAHLSGGANGPLGSPVVQARLTSAAGSAGEAAWEGLDGGLTVERHGAGGWFVASDGRVILQLPNTYPQLGEVFWRLGAGLDTAAELIRLASLQVDSHSARLSVLGTIGGWGSDMRLHVGLRGEDLQQLLAPLGVAARGMVEAELAVAGNLRQGELIIVGGGSGMGLTTGMSPLDTLLGGAPRLRIAAGMSAGGIPFAAALAGSHGSLTVGGLSDELSTAVARLHIPDIRGLAGPETGGAVSATALIAGGSGGLAAAATIATDATRKGYGPLRAKAVIGAADLLTRPDLRIAARLGVAGVDADASATVTVGDAISIQDLLVTAGPDRIGGDVTFRPDSGQVVGSLQGRVEDLRRWSEAAGQPLAGSLAATARLRSEAGVQAADATVEASGLRLGGLSMRRLEAQAAVTDLLGKPAGRLTAVASELSGSDVAITRARLWAEGTLAALEFSVEANGRAREPLAMTAGGRASVAGSERRVTLRALDVSYGGQQARLGQPAEMVWGPAGIVLSPATLALAGGDVVLAGSLVDDAIEARLRLNSVPLDVAELALPGRDLTGAVSGEVTAVGRLPEPRVRLSLSGRRLGVPRADGEAAAPRLDAEVQGDWDAGRAQLTLRAVSGERVAAQAEGSFPLVVGTDGGWELPPGGLVAGRIDLDADLARLTDVLPLVGQQLSGQLRAGLAVAGTVAQPDVTGTARLSGGAYENFISGTRLRDVAATVTAADAGVFEVVGQATDGGAGRLSLQGNVATAPDGVGYQMAGTLAEFTALRLDAATAVASGAFRIEGLGRQAALAGSIKVERGDVDIARALPARVVTLDVIEVNRPGGPRKVKEQAAALQGEAPLTLGLDVAVQVQRLFVRGRGLDSEWQGDLVVGGTASRPTVVGDLGVVRGRYDFLGRDFRLSPDSRIVFDGGEEINPRLAVVAEAKAEEIMARVNVDGDVRRPEVAFSSEPSYPSDEILSRLLFGKEAGQLTVGQQVQLARAAASLAGGGGGFDPVGSIRGMLGLDVLEIGAAEGDEGRYGPTVSAGKYLDENTFLRLEQGTKGSSVAIERELGRGLSVETEVGQQSGSGVGLNWRMDY